MPYKIRRRKECYQVYNTETDRIYSKCATLENAKRQMRLLYATDTGWKPTGKRYVKKIVRKSPKKSKRVVKKSVKKSPAKSKWLEYLASQMKRPKYQKMKAGTRVPAIAKAYKLSKKT